MASFVYKNFLHLFEHRTDQFLATFCNFVIIVPDQIMASTSLLTIVQSFDLSLFLIVPHKFSMGFKSGEFPGHSKTFIPFFCNTFCTFLAEWQRSQIMLEYAPTIRKWNLHVSHNLMIDYINVLVSIHYSQARIE